MSPDDRHRHLFPASVNVQQCSHCGRVGSLQTTGHGLSQVNPLDRHESRHRPLCEHRRCAIICCGQRSIEVTSSITGLSPTGPKSFPSRDSAKPFRIVSALLVTFSCRALLPNFYRFFVTSSCLQRLLSGAVPYLGDWENIIQKSENGGNAILKDDTPKAAIMRSCGLSFGSAGPIRFWTPGGGDGAFRS